MEIAGHVRFRRCVLREVVWRRLRQRLRQQLFLRVLNPIIYSKFHPKILVVKIAEHEHVRRLRRLSSLPGWCRQLRLRCRGFLRAHYRLTGFIHVLQLYVFLCNRRRKYDYACNQIFLRWRSPGTNFSDDSWHVDSSGDVVYIFDYGVMKSYGQ